MTQDTQPRPDMIGGVPTPPLAILPRPESLFRRRAERLAFLAQDSRLGDYLSFLAAIAELQAGLCAEFGPAAAPDAAWLAQARAARMPPIDRHALRHDADLAATLRSVLDRTARIDMPAPARLALDALRAATPEDLDWVLGNVLDDAIPADSAAPHVFAAVAVQVHLARLASALDAGDLVRIRTGVCPCCGGRPGASLVTGLMGAEGARYAACAGCQTLWNEVRIMCLACGSNKGIAFKAVDDGTGTAQIKAETCGDCHSWLKQLAQNTNAALDPVADDVATLGLDALMQDGTWRRAGVNPFLVGY